MALLGPNGAGKSTTIAACLGLLPYRSGTIRVFGVDPASHRREIHARVGVLPERLGFYDWMTAAEYLTFLLAFTDATAMPTMSVPAWPPSASSADSRSTIGAYSHGMRQRLGLARALVADPELLILDEPTSGLDPRGRREIHDILWQLSHERGVAVLLCTHLLDDVERLCTRIGILSAGRTVAEGRLPDLLGDGGPRRYWLRLGGVAPSGTTPMGCVRCMSMGERTLVELAPGAVPSAVWRGHALGRLADNRDHPPAYRRRDALL